MLQRMTTTESGLNAQVGHAIDTYLKWRHLTRADLAAHLGISGEYLRDKIKGRRKWYFSEVAAAASLLGVAIDELIGGHQNLKYLIRPEPVAA